MKKEFEQIPLIKNEDRKRFEIEVNGHYAFVNYGEYGSQVALVHTEAEPELKGTGAASAVIEKTLQLLKENGKTVLPYCPFVFAFIKKHPEWKQVVDNSFNGYSHL